MKFWLPYRFIALGAEVPPSSRAGDDDVVGVERDREQRALLPLEHLDLAPFGPDFRGAAPFHDQVLLLVKVLLDVERASARHLDDVHAPEALRPPKLDEGPLSAHALPWLQREVLNPANTDRTHDRNLLLF